MKNKNVNQLAFNKCTVIELNDGHLAEINGGTNTTQAPKPWSAGERKASEMRP